MTRTLSVLFVLGLASAASGQGTALNPTKAQFTASADHAAGVTRYELRHYAAGVATPIRIDDLGKPTPDAAGTITATFPALPKNPDRIYLARVAAIGPAGATESLDSLNGYLFADGAELTLAQKVKLAVAGLNAAGQPAALPDDQIVVWTIVGSSPTNILGTFDTVPLPGGGVEPAAAWFLPAKAGTYTIEISFVFSGTPYTFRVAVIVTTAP